MTFAWLQGVVRPCWWGS